MFKINLFNIYNYSFSFDFFFFFLQKSNIKYMYFFFSHLCFLYEIFISFLEPKTGKRYVRIRYHIILYITNMSI
jgi:hypothetical protein